MSQPTPMDLIATANAVAAHNEGALSFEFLASGDVFVASLGDDDAAAIEYVSGLPGSTWNEWQISSGGLTEGRTMSATLKGVEFRVRQDRLVAAQKVAA